MNCFWYGWEQEESLRCRTKLVIFGKFDEKIGCTYLVGLITVLVVFGKFDEKIGCTYLVGLITVLVVVRMKY